MVAHGRVELLAHPLSQKYLQMKWNSYGKYFHLANLLFYCVFLAFVTIYTYFLMSTTKPALSLTNKQTGKCPFTNASANTPDKSDNNTQPTDPKNQTGKFICWNRQMKKSTLNTLPSSVSIFIALSVIRSQLLRTVVVTQFRRWSQ